MRALATATAERMPRPGIRAARTPATLADESVLPAFRISEAARAWLSGPGPVAVVQVGSTANLAVGDVAWGPAALGATVAEAEVPSRRAGSPSSVVPSVPDHPACATVDRLRAAGHDVVLVECGWPRGGADIETFGGSPAVARALLALLRGEVST